MFIRVDLPEPLAPINATNSPRLISSDTPRTAGTSISSAIDLVHINKPNECAVIHVNVLLLLLVLVAHARDRRHARRKIRDSSTPLGMTKDITEIFAGCRRTDLLA